MAGFKSLQTRTKSLTKQKIENDLIQIIKSLEPDLIKLNLSQLQKGETKEGELLPPYAGTKIPWKLKNTGKFYSDWFVEVRGTDAIIFGSKDSKTEIILDKLKDRGIKKPENIFGLSEENFIKFQKILVPKIKEYFNSILLSV